MPSARPRTYRALLAAALLAPLLIVPALRGGTVRPAPEFPTQEPARWVGDPVRLAGLRGKVVLLDVWTFG